MTDIHKLLDDAHAAADEYLNAGANGRQEKAIVQALGNLADAIRELAPKPKAKAEAKDDAPAKKAPAKKATTKKAAGK